MTNFIEEFYYGNIEPQEYPTEFTGELKKKLNRLCETEEELTEKLHEKEKPMFKNYVSTYNDFYCVSLADSFMSGFKLGARFTYDAFVDTKKG